MKTRGKPGFLLDIMGVGGSDWLYSVSRRQARSLNEVRGGPNWATPYMQYCIPKMYQLLLMSLVIDLADDSQVEPLGYRVNVHYEVRGARRPFKTARASHKLEDSLIDTRNRIQDSGKLNE